MCLDLLLSKNKNFNIRKSFQKQKVIRFIQNNLRFIWQVCK